MARAKKKVSCQDCDRTFGRKGELQQHRREEHSRKNMCPICKRAFESEKRLKMHSQFHNAGGEYKCFYCPKQFNKAWKMKIHLVNHSGRPSYICEYCGDDFLYPGKIVAHLKRVHQVVLACKDCGFAIPLVRSPHKCRIYGCKDCLSSFATKVELAEHVDTHAGRCAPPVHLLPEELDPSSPPQDTRQQCEGYLGVQQACDTPQEAPLQNGREKNGDCESPEAVLGVAEDTYPAKANGVKRHRGNESRVNRVSWQGPDNAFNGVRGSECGRRVSPGSGVAEEPCKARLQHLEVNERLSRDALVSPSPPSTPTRCTLANYSDVSRDSISEWTLVVQGHCATVNTSVIRDKREVEGNEEAKETEPPSYFSSILLRSPSRDLRSGFKVPDAGMGVWKKVETPISRSLRRKQDELDRAAKKRDLLNTLQFYVDTDARLTQRSQTSFKSWLTGDSFSSSSPEHDYVFGFEASVSVGSRSEEAHHYYFNKKIPKKAKVDMTFEDLCLF